MPARKWHVTTAPGAEHTHGRCVYFLRHERTGLIKIGVTLTPHIRFPMLASETRSSLHVLAMARGGYSDERRLHAVLSASRVGREWVRDTDEVRAVVASIAATPEPAARAAPGGTEAA